jgi:hypothetical protein
MSDWSSGAVVNEIIWESADAKRIVALSITSPSGGQIFAILAKHCPPGFKRHVKPSCAYGTRLSDLVPQSLPLSRARKLRGIQSLHTQIYLYTNCKSCLIRVMATVNCQVQITILHQSTRKLHLERNRVNAIRGLAGPSTRNARCASLTVYETSAGVSGTWYVSAYMSQSASYAH